MIISYAVFFGLVLFVWLFVLLKDSDLKDHILYPHGFPKTWDPMLEKLGFTYSTIQRRLEGSVSGKPVYISYELKPVHGSNRALFNRLDLIGPTFVTVLLSRAPRRRFRLRIESRGRSVEGKRKTRLFGVGNGAYALAHYVDEEKLRKILERADWSFPGEGEITAFNRRCFIKLPSTQLNGEMMEALIYFLVEVAQRIEENVLLEADTKTSQVQNSSQPVIASPLPNSPPALPSGWTAFALRHDLVTHPAERALSGEWGEWEVALRAMQFGHGAYLNPALQQGTQVQIVLIEGLEACLNLTIRRLDSELEFSTVLESDTVLEGIVEGFMPLAVLLEERMENDLFPAVAAIHENVLTLTLPGLISSSAALRQLLDAATGLADRIELAVIEKMESITLETLHR